MKNFALGLVVLFSFPLYAQRTGNNGGGLAELQVVYIHQHIPNLVAACMVTENPCELNTDEKMSLNRLLQAHTEEVARTKIMFDVDLDEKRDFETSREIGHDIIFNPNRLYDPDGAVKSLKELSQIVIRARLFHVSSLGELDLRSLAEKVTTRVSSISHTLVIEDSPTPIYFHDFRFEIGGKANRLLILEDQMRSFNLTELFKDPLEYVPRDLENIRSFRRDNAYVILIDAGPKHRIQVQFEINERGEILDTSLRLQILKVSQ